ncbi:MAG: DUF192 domain-containing protein [Hyphomicrobiales bacterium]|nr:DUF192 domain-containing protein [Hyphomicrobiales bacterium]
MALSHRSARALAERLGRLLVGWAVAVLVAAAPLAMPPARAEALIATSERLEVATARGRVAFSVEVVDTDETRANGLMFRKEMAADHGMLFDFRREQPVWFWMKNTYLPLDMIFARADGVILSIAPDATPLSEATIGSGGPVRFVLEVNAGVAAKLGLRPGDRLIHPRMRSQP